MASRACEEECKEAPQSGWSRVKRALLRVAKWTVVWGAAYQLGLPDWLASLAFGTRYTALRGLERRRFNTYIFSMLNCCLSSGWILREHAIHSQFIPDLRWEGGERPSKEGNQTVISSSKRLMAVISGYLVNDFLVSSPDWLAKPSDVIHHLTGLAIMLPALCAAPDSIFRWVPWFGLAEISTIFLNGSWLLKQAGVGSSVWTRVNLILFAISFFLVRVALFPYMSLLLWKRYDGLKSIGLGRWAMIPLNVLQWYWFFKIVQMVLK